MEDMQEARDVGRADYALKWRRLTAVSVPDMVKDGSWKWRSCWRWKRFFETEVSSEQYSTVQLCRDSCVEKNVMRFARCSSR